MQKEITFSTFIRWAGIVLLIGAVLGALNYLSDVLMPFFVAWLFAYLLYPIVKFIENRLHIRFRPLSITLTLLFVSSIIALVIYLIIPPMIEQFQKLYDILIHWLRETNHNNDISAWLSKKINENQEQITNFFKSRDFADALKTTAPKLFNLANCERFNQHWRLNDHLIIYVLYLARLRILDEKLDKNIPQKGATLLA